MFPRFNSGIPIFQGEVKSSHPTENWNGGAAYLRIIGTEGPKIGGADFL